MDGALVVNINTEQLADYIAIHVSIVAEAGGHTGHLLNHPKTRFIAPAGPVPRFKRASVFMFDTHLGRPNWWWRFWQRALLGWRWEVLPSDSADNESKEQEDG